MSPDALLLMRDLVTAALMLCGAGFMLLAGIGMVRLPDLFIRMHAATKSGTLGVVGMMLATAVHFGQAGVTTQVILVIVFMFLTAPVAAHFIARAAYFVGVPLWEQSVTDELKGRYTSESGEPASEDFPEQQAGGREGPA